ncbi:MAG: M56 family metallopeptidase, partial [Gemmatimonadetes bacterium]|nr:M56 family metallopeptidase [Gemmatimonadota bacterium]
MILLPDAPSLLELALRATALLGGALLLDRILRGAPALTRHGLWAATTLALLALPMLHARLPRLPIPGWTIESPAPAPVSRVSFSPDVVPEALAPSVAIPARTLDVASSPPPRVRPTVGQVLAALWAVVMLAIAASIGRGILRARRLLRDAVVVTAPRLLARLAHARRLTGVRQPVRLACAEQVRTPMTGGFRHPTILVPSESVSWPDDLLDTVLRHELIHIRRHDALHQLLSRCSVAL